MRKTLAAIILACGLATITPTPASAEAGWVATDCHAAAPTNSQRTITVAPVFGPIFWYRNAYSAGLGKPLYGNALYYYGNAGFDCGRFGLLYSQGIMGYPQQEQAIYYWFYFAKPGDCDMRYIITMAVDNEPIGFTYDGTIPNYFCQ